MCTRRHCVFFWKRWVALKTFQPQILLDYAHNRRSRNASLARYFPDCSVSLRLVFLANNQIINKIHVFFHSSTAWPVNSTSFSELLKQHVDATFRPSFVRKFWKQPASIVSFRQMQTCDQCLVSRHCLQILQWRVFDVISAYQIYS